MVEGAGAPTPPIAPFPLVSVPVYYYY